MQLDHFNELAESERGKIQAELGSVKCPFSYTESLPYVTVAQTTFEGRTFQLKGITFNLAHIKEYHSDERAIENIKHELAHAIVGVRDKIITPEHEICWAVEFEKLVHHKVICLNNRRQVASAKKLSIDLKSGIYRVLEETVLFILFGVVPFWMAFVLFLFVTQSVQGITTISAILVLIGATTLILTTVCEMLRRIPTSQIILYRNLIAMTRIKVDNKLLKE